MLYQISFYFLLFIGYAFLGWIVETICCSFLNKKPILNRGFLLGPICPIYGYGAIFLILLLKKYYDDPFGLLIMAAVGASVLEYITSYVMEKIFKARWWDYSERKFNINGRICLENALLFGVLGLFLMYVINPIYCNILLKLSSFLLETIAISIFIIYVVDNIITFTIMFELRSNFELVKKKDNTQQINEQIKQILTKNRVFKNRIINAFPNMKLPSNQFDIERLRTILKKRKKK